MDIEIQTIATPIENLLKRIKINPDIRFLCLDMGRKKIGLATCYYPISVTIPYKTIQNQGIKKTIEIIDALCKDVGSADVVIGLPIQDNILDKSAQYILNFAENFSSKLKINLYFQDESFSSCIANELLSEIGLKRKKREVIDDAVAASIILNNFIIKINKLLSLN